MFMAALYSKLLQLTNRPAIHLWNADRLDHPNRLARHYPITKSIIGIITTVSILVDVDLQHVLGSVWVMLKSGQALD